MIDSKSEMPYVSILTPTFNRRPFIPYLIEVVRQQNYPKDRIEWIILDDGTDYIEDILNDPNLDKKDLPIVRYFKHKTKLKIGHKRNILNKLSKGDIMVCMDDDDYYPQERIIHAVQMLNSNRRILCGGTSKMYCWYNREQKMYTFGPYLKSHATANTFAYKRELLKISKFSDNDSLSEEKAFLKNYTIPFIQFDPLKTVIQFAHNQNSYDKEKFKTDNELRGNNLSRILESQLNPKQIIKDPKLFDFYTSSDIMQILDSYSIGDRSYKLDIVQELKKRSQKKILEGEPKSKK